MGGNPLSSFDPLGLAPDMNLTHPDDKLWPRMEERINVPGWYVVSGHGNQWFMEGPNRERIYADKLAALIKADPKYIGQPILLASCNTAMSGGVNPKNGQPIPSLAEALSAHMNNTVKGAKDFSYFPPNSPTWGAGTKLIPPSGGRPWVTVQPSGNQ